MNYKNVSDRMQNDIDKNHCSEISTNLQVIEDIFHGAVGLLVKRLSHEEGELNRVNECAHVYTVQSSSTLLTLCAYWQGAGTRTVPGQL